MKTEVAKDLEYAIWSALENNSGLEEFKDSNGERSYVLAFVKRYQEASDKTDEPELPEPILDNAKIEKLLELVQKRGVFVRLPEAYFEYVEQGIMTELRVYGFAAAKAIAGLRGRKLGVMPCPLCGSDMRFSTAESNGHFHVNCSRDGCLKMGE